MEKDQRKSVWFPKHLLPCTAVIDWVILAGDLCLFHADHEKSITVEDRNRDFTAGQVPNDNGRVQSAAATIGVVLRKLQL